MLKVILFLWKLGFNDWKTKVDDTDVGKWKIVPMDLKKLSDAISKKVVKNSVQH